MSTPSRQAVIDGIGTLLKRLKPGQPGPDDITEESALDDLGLDSLDLLEFRFEIESRWSVTLTDDEARGLRTVADVIELVLARGQA